MIKPISLEQTRQHLRTVVKFSLMISLIMNDGEKILWSIFGISLTICFVIYIATRDDEIEELSKTTDVINYRKLRFTNFNSF